MTALTPATSVVKTQPVQVVNTNPSFIEAPSAWMRYGNSPTEIILAIAFLLKVLVPVMLHNSTKK